jgi:hypothetical protein
MTFLTSVADGTTMSLMDSHGIPEINFRVAPDGKKLMLVSDSKSRRTIGLELDSDGAGHISIGGLGQSGLALMLLPGEGPTLQFFDKDSKTRIKLGLQADGSPGMEFFDESGKITFRAPTAAADNQRVTRGAKGGGGSG